MASITFILAYNSFFGEDLFIVGNIPELGLQDKSKSLPLSYTDEGWKITVEIEAETFNYSYFVRRGNEISRKERSLSHSFSSMDKTLKIKQAKIYDQFLDEVISRPMFSAVFSKSIMVRTETAEKGKEKKMKEPIIFKTMCPEVSRDYVLAISGSDAMFGKWTEDDVQVMDEAGYPKFYFVCDATKILFPLEYKYVLLDRKSHAVVMWENGTNRYLNPSQPLSGDLIVVNDRMPQFDIPCFKGAGIAIPVFSLRSKKGFGTGEFLDLKLLIDWAEKTGMKMIQTLPVNDTTATHTWKDSYPYNSISTIALHPMYLNLERVGKVSDVQRYEKLRKELYSNKFLDYEAVNKYKWEFIYDIYQKEKEKISKNKEYRLFLNENKEWLHPYAVFCYLREKHKTVDTEKWGKDAQFQRIRVEQYCSPKFVEYDAVAIHLFVQFHLHQQLLEVQQYAHSKGIAMKGDIPIGVNRHSVDVWEHPELFDCTGQTGAPPDDFSEIGQNWGFPMYNWDEMEKDDYQWWTRRFRKMAQYYDAYRIDHILGFFRVFRIPFDEVWGLLGQFSSALPLSIEEIREFGINFNEDDFCQPYINEGYLNDLFGENKDKVKERYFVALGNKRFQLKEEVNTQKKIEKLFENSTTTEENELKRDLMKLVCQVLFIKDIKEKDKFHPRIVVQESLPFRTLDSQTKEALNRLYLYFYYERHDEFWKSQGLKKLTPLINSTDMMVCGEDLGMIPRTVPEVMSELEILSLEVQRMPKEIDVEFGDLEKIPYLSVCTTSTHDMTTIRAWWEEDRQRAQRYFNNVLHEYGLVSGECEPWICQRIIEKHLYSPAMWVILPFQDWISMDGELRWKQTFQERINDPGNPNNQWKYRMHISLEDLLENGSRKEKFEKFNSSLKSMIKQADR